MIGEVHRLVQSWDTAIKNSPSADFSVCTIWGWEDGVWYLMDIAANASSIRI
jgi:phage terminase large subunit-like protein